MSSDSEEVPEIVTAGSRALDEDPAFDPLEHHRARQYQRMVDGGDLDDMLESLDDEDAAMSSDDYDELAGVEVLPGSGMDEAEGRRVLAETREWRPDELGDFLDGLSMAARTALRPTALMAVANKWSVKRLAAFIWDRVCGMDEETFIISLDNRNNAQFEAGEEFTSIFGIDGVQRLVECVRLLVCGFVNAGVDEIGSILVECLDCWELDLDHPLFVRFVGLYCLSVGEAKHVAMILKEIVTDKRNDPPFPVGINDDCRPFLLRVADEWDNGKKSAVLGFMMAYWGWDTKCYEEIAAAWKIDLPEDIPKKVAEGKRKKKKSKAKKAAPVEEKPKKPEFFPVGYGTMDDLEEDVGFEQFLDDDEKAAAENDDGMEFIPMEQIQEFIAQMGNLGIQFEVDLPNVPKPQQKRPPKKKK